MIDALDPYGLLRRLPRIRRARGFRLYAESGARLLDLWQCGGSAVLGHTPPRVLTAFKDSASRGLFCPFPSAYGPRFASILSTLIPGRVPRWYASFSAAQRALSEAAFDPIPAFVDPAFEPYPQGCKTGLWRPWIPGSVAGELPSVLLPILPLPFPGAPVAFLLEEGAASGFPPSDTVSPVVLAAAARAAADLKAALGAKAIRPSARFATALGQISGVSLRGAYLSFSESSDAGAYTELFMFFLQKGILLPPDPCLPSIIPGELSPGEESSLIAAIAER